MKFEKTLDFFKKGLRKFSQGLTFFSSRFWQLFLILGAKPTKSMAQYSKTRKREGVSISDTPSLCIFVRPLSAYSN
jgi:hypothetical protein